MSSVEIHPSELKFRAPGLSYEDFLQSGPDRHAEWVRGEVIEMSPASGEHQDIVLFLGMILRHYLDFHSLGHLYIAPFQMKLDLSGREPDLLFVLNSNLERIKTNRLEGPADLAIEIVSPESGERDRVEKFREYQKAGVREYWLIDPDLKQSEFYGLDKDGLYHLLPIEADGRFTSRVVEGLWVRPEWFFTSPLPPALSVLREWDLLP